MAAVAITPEMRAYRPYGSAREAMLAKEPEVLMSGPAGTGKSRAWLEKLHICAEKYPGMRALIVRKTRESLTESGLVTWEEKVVPVGHAILGGAQRRMRQAYHYPNGSEVVIGGLDKPGKIMSTEFDLIYVQEAIDLEENDWESLTTRLRNGVMPYQQLVGDTNPDKPAHWLIQRCNKGATRLIESRHEDNPTIWDETKGEYTRAGALYIATLDRLTGPRHARLRHGKWVAAEGQIYEDWDSLVHMMDRRDIPSDWPCWWLVDFGYTNPFVWQEWFEDPDGRLIRATEIYHTKRLVEDHAHQMLERAICKTPQAIICDHDAEDRATLERHLGMRTVGAKKDVSPGIQAVQARLRKQDDGKPRIYFMRDALVERDSELADAKKPCCTEEEFDGYIWDPSRKKGEQPLKQDDHGMDTTRYMVAQRDIRTTTTIFIGTPSTGAQTQT